MLISCYRQYSFLCRTALIAIVLAWSAPLGAVGLVYVDARDHLAPHPSSPYPATPQNLFTSSGAPLADALDAIGTNQTNFTDGKWGFRIDALGARGSIYETANEDPPEIYQLLTGLSPGESYDVYVAYWSSTGNWAIRAGETSNPNANPVFDRTGALGTAGLPAVYAAWDVLPEDNYSSNDTDGAGVLTQEQNAVTLEGNRAMLLGPAVMNKTADANGEIRVYIDDASNVTNERSFLDGLAYAPAGTAIALHVEVDRVTGNVSIVNDTSQDFRIARYSVSSAASQIDPSQWNTIAGNLDGSDEGNMTLDTDPWNVSHPNPNNPLPPRAGTLREVEVNVDMMGLDSDGALIAAGSTLDLGNVWIPSAIEDLVIQAAPLLVASSTAPDTAVSLAVNYVNGDARVLGDFDDDGSIDESDYALLLQNMHRSLSSITIGEAYLYGDMNGDREINFFDLAAFSQAYDAMHGAGAFALIGTAVPEPGTCALLIVAIVAAVGMRRSNGRKSACLALTVPMAFIGVSICSTAGAQDVVYIDAEPSNTVLESSGALIYTPTVGQGGNVVGTASATDGRWAIRQFANNSIAPWFNGINQTIFESTGSENPQRLITTFTLPESGLYQIYGFYWDDASGWDADFELGDRGTKSYRAGFDGISVEAALFDSVTGVSVDLKPGVGGLADDEGNRNMYAAPLGVWSTDIDGLDVTVKTHRSLVSTSRTWFDGVGYSPVVDPLVVAEVNLTTGEVVLRNPFEESIEFSYYELRSDGSGLQRHLWNSLDDQNWDAVDGNDPGTVAGDSLLEGWDQTSTDSQPGDFNLDGSVDAADYTVWRNGLGADYTAADYTLWKENFGATGFVEETDILAESRLLGPSTLGPGESLSLGNIYNTSLDTRDLQFTFGHFISGAITPSLVLYTEPAGALSMSASAVPEPGTAILLAGMALLLSVASPLRGGRQSLAG